MKTVLVTGATSGFGKGLVLEFLSEDFRVVATGRKLLDRKDIFKNERAAFGDRLVELDLDVTSKTDLEKIAAYFQIHPLDVLVNNAGFAVFGPAEECSEEKIRRQFEVNFFGLVILTQKLLPTLRKSRGHVINFSSVFGIMGFPLSSAYCASKFAVEGFSESLSYEMKPFGVRVSLVEPGGYRTNFNNNVEWGATPDPKSVYYKQIQNYALLREKLSSHPSPQDPQEVIAGVVRIARSQHPKLGYTFGKDAFATKVIKGLLPRQVFHRMTGRFINKIFSKDLE